MATTLSSAKMSNLKDKIEEEALEAEKKAKKVKEEKAEKKVTKKK